MMAPFNRSEGIPWRPGIVSPALARLLRSPQLGVVLVAEKAPTRKLVGYVVATYNYDLEFAGSDAFVTELFVRPRERGKGHAKLLLQAVTQAVEENGARAVHLLVRPENRGARRLYATVGFDVMPRLMMTKELSSRRAT
jgi:ribosomal protein S18 acetylase RimI-like enzyme